jgi:hypothetical protein
MDGFTCEIDSTRALQMLEQLGVEAERVALEAAIETGQAVDAEATARVRRAEGVTAANIVSREHLPEYLGGGPGKNPTSVFVYVEAKRRPDNIAIWLNFGTKHIVGDNFMFDAVRVEEANHYRRLNDGLTDLCEGLGD